LCRYAVVELTCIKQTCSCRSRVEVAGITISIIVITVSDSSAIVSKVPYRAVAVVEQILHIGVLGPCEDVQAEYVGRIGSGIDDLP